MDEFQGINSLLEFNVFGGELCLQDQWDVRKGELEMWMSYDGADLVICLTKLLLDVLRTSLSKRGDSRVEGRTRVVERMLVEVPNGKGLVARCGSLVRIGEGTNLMFLPKAENLSMIAIESEADGWRDDGANAAREEWAMGRERFVWNWFQADECHLGTLGVRSACVPEPTSSQSGRRLQNSQQVNKPLPQVACAVVGLRRLHPWPGNGQSHARQDTRRLSTSPKRCPSHLKSMCMALSRLLWQDSSHRMLWNPKASSSL